jgi:hypothetical protein
VIPFRIFWINRFLRIMFNAQFSMYNIQVAKP